MGLEAYFYLRPVHHPGVHGAGRALYESWTSPAAVLLTVPMAMVGVLVRP